MIIVLIVIFVFVMLCVGGFVSGWQRQQSYKNINKMAKMMKAENERKEGK